MRARSAKLEDDITSSMTHLKQNGVGGRELPGTSDILFLGKFQSCIREFNSKIKTGIQKSKE